MAVVVNGVYFFLVDGLTQLVQPVSALPFRELFQRGESRPRPSLLLGPATVAYPSLPHSVTTWSSGHLVAFQVWGIHRLLPPAFFGAGS